MKTTCASFKQPEYRDIVSVLTSEDEQCDAAECEDVAVGVRAVRIRWWRVSGRHASHCVPAMRRRAAGATHQVETCGAL